MIVVIAGLCALALPASASAGTGGTALRDVLVVSNNRAGTADLVDPRTFKSIVNVGAGGVPYRSTTSRDGRYCFVSVARKDRVSVISFASGKEVARIPVGLHPQRMRAGRARADLL